MTLIKRLFIPIGVGILASLLMSGVYFGIVSWAESFQHAVDFFWQDWYLIIPIIGGFGIQAALFTVLKLRLFIPVASTAASGALTGAGGATSTMSMVACCAHHVADVLPFLGLSAAASFLANYRLVFMGIGLATTITGIVVMLVVLVRARRMAINHLATMAEAA